MLSVAKTMILRTISLLILLFFLPTPVLPASITSEPTFDMSNFTESGKRIFLSGKIEKGDCQKIREKILTSKYTMEQLVIHNSSGGNGNEAWCISDMIIKNGMDTLVYQFCYSACAKIWLSGKNKYLIKENSQIGFHSPFDQQGKKLEVQSNFLMNWILRIEPQFNKELLTQMLSLGRDELFIFSRRGIKICEITTHHTRIVNSDRQKILKCKNVDDELIRIGLTIIYSD